MARSSPDRATAPYPVPRHCCPSTTHCRRPPTEVEVEDFSTTESPGTRRCRWGPSLARVGAWVAGDGSASAATGTAGAVEDEAGNVAAPGTAHAAADTGRSSRRNGPWLLAGLFYCVSISSAGSGTISSPEERSKRGHRDIS